MIAPSSLPDTTRGEKGTEAIERTGAECPSSTSVGRLTRNFHCLTVFILSARIERAFRHAIDIEAEYTAFVTPIDVPALVGPPIPLADRAVARG